MNKTLITTLLFATSVLSMPTYSGTAPLIQPGTGTGTGNGTGTGTGGGTTTTTETLTAINDEFTITLGAVTTKVTGNLTDNDKGFESVSLQSSPISSYGYLEFNSAGEFSYTVNERAPEVVALTAGQLLKDTFTYVIKAGSKTKKATLTVTILGNPANNSSGVNTPVQNVEVEFNNTRKEATQLNPGQLIKGHLYDSGDKDWYSINSSGNEIIHIEVCAKGSVCFDKKSWVMYVFDGDKLTDAMENAKHTLLRYRDDGGGVVGSYEADDMYLLYNSGAFEGALIGVVDPCFDTTNSVDIGTPKGARTYFVGISVPLKRDGKDCNDGSIILKKPGLPVSVFDPETGKNKQVPTTLEYVSAFPNSDDEYDITVTNTGKNPLAVSDGSAKSSESSAFTQVIPVVNSKSRQLTIPKLRIANDVYSATLSYQGSLLKKKPAKKVKLKVKKITKRLDSSSGNAYEATVNPENNEVVLSTVRDKTTGITYSAVLKYHPKVGKKPRWLEAISVTPW